MKLNESHVNDSIIFGTHFFLEVISKLKCGFEMMSLRFSPEAGRSRNSLYPAVSIQFVVFRRATRKSA